MKTAFNTEMLNHLIEKAGFAAVGDAKAAANFLHDVLKLGPFYENQKELDALLPECGMYYFVLNLVDNIGVLEHGGGIGGSWLTDEGYAMRHALDQIDWDAPADLTGAIAAPRVKINPPWEDAKIYWTVMSQMNFCACGRPEEMLAFFFKVLGAAKNTDTGAFAQLLPNAGMRQFVMYQLMHLGVIDTNFVLTEHGKSIFEKLELLEIIDFEDDEEF
jgi:hypothetical protein